MNSLQFDFPDGSDGKASAYNAGDLGSIPGSGRSPGEGNGNPLQYSCLENLMDGGVVDAAEGGASWRSLQPPWPVFEFLPPGVHVVPSPF